MKKHIRFLSVVGALVFALLASRTEAANTFTVVPTSTSYSSAGGTISFDVTFSYTDPMNALSCALTAPSGWKFGVASGANVPELKPDSAQAGIFDFLYMSTPPDPPATRTFSFTVTYPANKTGNQVFTSVSGLFGLSSGASATVTQSNITFTLAVPPAFTSADNAAFTVGTAGTFTVAASGSPAPTLSVVDPLPTGVNFNTSTGVLSGTPLSVVGSPFSLSFTAANGVPSAATQTFTLTVNKATPTVTWGAPGAIVYGTALSSTQLNATASLAGSFAYTPVAGTVLNVGATQTLAVTFTPTDAVNYNSVNTSSSITVSKATPTVGWNAPSAISYGTALSAAQLNATASVPGNFVYSPVAGTMLNAGNSQTLSVTFTPTDTANYSVATATTSINVSKLAPVVSWSAPVDITYGTALTAARLNATANVPGTFAYTPVVGTVLNAGASQTLSVTFTPTDTTNYTPASTTTSITVSKATPTVAWTSPTAITYGTALSASQLNATTGVPGAFVYTPAAGTVLNTGADQALSVSFAPTDAGNYNPATGSTTITVQKATPTITWTAPAGITYGTALSGPQLTPSANVAGSFVYSPDAGTILNAGSNQTLSATFTPNDTANYAATTANVAINVAKATPTVNWTAPTGIVYGTSLSATQLNATASVAGTFVYAPVAATVLEPGSGQNLAVTFTPTDAANYNPATGSVQISVSKAPATVTLANLTHAYNGSAKNATATANPTVQNITIAYTNTATPSTPPVAAGTYGVTATIVDARYEGSASDSLTITKADQAITFAALVPKAVDSAPFALTATADSGLAVAYSLSNNNPTSGNPADPVATISNGTVTLLNRGNITITASQAGTGNYNAASPVPQGLSVLAQSQNIVFEATQLPAKTYKEAPFAISATSSRGLTVNFVSSNATVATVVASTLNPSTGVSSATVTIMGAGSTTITAKQPGNDNTASADDVPWTLAVAKANQVITFAALANKTFLEPAFDVIATSDSGLAPTFSVVSGPATIAGKTVSITGGGSVTIRAAQAGNDNFNLAPTVDRTFTVAKAAQTISFGALAAKTFGDAPFLVSATASSGLPVSFASSVSSVATVSGNTITLVGGGTTTLTASQAGDANYSLATAVPVTLTVNPAAATVTLGSLSATYSGTAKSATATTSPAALPVVFTYDGSSTAPTNAGTYAVVGTINHANYTGSASGSLVIAKADQTIVFSTLAAKTFGTAPFTVSATASSGLPVSFASATSSVATVSGNTVTLVGVGTTDITASQAGNTNYNAATPVIQPQVVNQLAQTITWAGTELAGKTVGNPAIPLVATASSGLTVSFASSNPTVATISGSTLTIVGPGTADITASQAGNANVVAAPSVTRTITVNPAATAPVVSVTGGNVRSATVGTAFGPVTLTATQTPTGFTIGALPAGLIVGGTTTVPTIGGTPTATPGTYRVAITATNSAGTGPVTMLVITVNPHALAPMISSAPVVSGRVGVSLTYTLAATPSGATTYGMAGALPAGLTFNGSAGTVTGIPAVGATGSYSVFFAGTNANGIGLALQVTFNIAPPLTVPVVNSNGTAAAQVGLAFTYQITATNSPTGYAAAPLPAGLSVNPLTGGITGVPTTPTGATPAKVSLTASNGDGASNPKTLAITIAPAPTAPTITSAASAIGTVNVAFTYTIIASGSPTSFNVGPLPAGLTVNTASGVISGTPTVAGSYPVSLSATNAAGTGASTTLTLTIAPAALAPAISSAATAVGQVGTAFTYQIVATPGPITSYALTGTLPVGLALNTATGAITGSPTQPDASTVSLTATNGNGTSAPQALFLQISAAANVPVITSAGSTTGYVGGSFTYQITATNTPHVTLDAINLPAGLAVNPFSGLIQGTPSAVGTTTVSLVGTNAAGTGPARDLTLVVQPAPSAPVVTGVHRVSAQVGVGFAYQLTASGGPMAFEVVGAPAWMTVNTATGALSGTPTAPGMLTVFLLASNSAGNSGPKLFTITIAAAANTPVVTSTHTAMGMVGSALVNYSITTAPAATSYVAAGLPPGLSLNGTTGVISGTPTASGIYPVTVSAGNAAGAGAPVVVVFGISPNIVFLP